MVRIGRNPKNAYPASGNLLCRLFLRWWPIFPIVFVAGIFLSSPNPAHAETTNQVSFTAITNRAWSQMRSHQWSEAETSFRSALQSNSNNPETLQGLMTSLYNSKKYGEAITVGRQTLEMKPGDTNLYYTIGLCYKWQEDYENSAVWFRKFIALKPRKAIGYFSLYQSLAEQRKFAEALEAIRQANSLNPTNALYQFQLGFCLEQLQNYDEAITQLNQSISLQPNNSTAYYYLGICHYNLRSYPLAIRAFDHALFLNPTNAYTRSALDWCVYELNSNPDAALSFRPESQTTAADPNGDLANRAWSQLESNHWDQAVLLFRSALELNRKNARLLGGLAASLYKEKEYGEAVTAFQQLLDVSPGETNAYLAAGVSYYRLGQYEKAGEFEKKYLLLRPADAVGREWLSLSLFHQTKYNEAIAVIQEAMKSDPDNTDLHIHLARCWDKLNRDDMAVKVLQQAVAIDPYDERVLQWLGRYFYLLENYSESAAAYQQVLALDPTNQSARYGLGLSLYFSKDFSSAATNFQQLTVLAPTNFGGFFWLGRSMESLHRFNEAANALKQALQIDPRNFDAAMGCGFMLARAGRYAEALTYLESAHNLKKENRPIRQVLFGCYILAEQYQKAFAVSPVGATAGGGVLVLGYLAGLTFLLRISLKLNSRPFPSVWFSLAWISLFLEGQLACICLLGLLSMAAPSLAKNAGGTMGAIILAGAPVICATARGFSRQPWGGPFAWPLQFGPSRMIWLALIVVGVLILTDSAYSAFFALVAHHSIPVQPSLPLVKFDLLTNPLAAIIAIVLVVPLVEEILFRGLLYASLEKHLPPGAVIFLTALCFALIHLQVVYFLPLFLMGVILGWLRRKSGSLGPSILVHCLNNGVSLILLKILGT